MINVAHTQDSVPNAPGDHVVILPASDDNNRGDQALVWETRRLVEVAGIAARFYYVKAKSSPGTQSRDAGLIPLEPLLRHPRETYTPKSNMRYGSLLLAIWGIIALKDAVFALLLLTTVGRRTLWRTLSRRQQQTLERIATSNSCVVKGGGFIHSTGSLADPYRAFYSLFYVFLARSLGRKVIVMPNSFGPIDGRLYRWLVTRALSSCELVTARESRSQAALSDIGVSSEVFPDLGFSLERAEIPGDKVECIRSGHQFKPLVGITARPYRFPRNSSPILAYEHYLDEVAEFARQISVEGYVPVFVEHVISAGSHESDAAAIAAIVSRLAPGSFEVIRVPDFNCRQIKALYGMLDFVVGTRFHSVIFALSEGVPAMAIAYGGNKGRGIMEDCNMSDYVMSIEQFAAEDALIKFRKLVNDADNARHVMELRSSFGRQHERLAELLGERLSKASDAE